VVRVQVRHQHQWQGVDAQPVQAPIDGPHVGARVHEHSGPRTGRQYQRVALPDVAGDGDRVLRRPSPHRLPERPAEHDEPDHRGERQRAQSWEPPETPAPDDEQDGQQHGPAAAGRPPRRRVRHRRGTFGHQHQPADRPAREPDEGVGQRRDGHSDDCGEQSDDGGRGNGRGSEQVGRQGDQADRAGQAGDDRCGREAGSGAHCERVGEKPRPAALAEPARPARREENDGGGRRHRQCEAGVAGQPGIVEQQHACGRAQGGDGGA
jgi:hypothetical protein